VHSFEAELKKVSRVRNKIQKYYLEYTINISGHCKIMSDSATQMQRME
jgi:hypothetical protein